MPQLRSPRSLCALTGVFVLAACSTSASGAMPSARAVQAVEALKRIAEG